MTWQIKDPATQKRVLANLYRGCDKRWRGRLKIPDRCPPLIRRLFEILNRDNITLKELAKRTGTNFETISDWRGISDPRLSIFEAALNATGHELKIVPKEDRS